jgi:hypothetical protein
MNNTAFSIRIYSYYLFLMGAALIIMPNALLTIFNFAPTSEIWIKMLGLFTFTTGIYYFYAAAHQQKAFYQATVVGRLFFFLMTVVFVIIFHQPLTLALIGTVDLMGGLWTYFTLQKDKEEVTS